MIPIPCECLSKAAFLVDELKTKSNDPGKRRIDSMLSTYKDALSRCKLMIECRQCQSKSEDMMMLNMVFEALVDICDFLVDAIPNNHTSADRAADTQAAEWDFSPSGALRV